MLTRLLAVLLCCASAALGSIAISGVTAQDIGHSGFEVDFATSGGSLEGVRARISTADNCSSGTGGTVEYIGWNSQGGASHQSTLTPLTANTWSNNVTGLSASTTYYVCIEVSADQSTWTSGTAGQVNGSGGSVTTIALPAVHPALPIAPATFAYGYPDMSAATIVTVSGSCNDPSTGLMALYAAAVAVQKTTKTIIEIPAGMVCSGIFDSTYNFAYFFDLNPPDVIPFAATNVTANTITISAGHGFTDGQQVIFAGNYSAIWSPESGNCGDSNNPEQCNIVPGHPYYIHVLNSTQFQVLDGPLGTGSTITLNPSGTAIYVAPWPRNLQWIVIRTATPDNQFTPAGTRTGPQWAPYMPVIESPASNAAASASPFFSREFFSTQYGDGNVKNLPANLFFMGLELTWAPIPDAAFSSDPPNHDFLVGVGWTSQNITFDRIYFHGLGAADNGERILKMLEWDGMNVAITNSYFDGMHWFHGTRSAGLSISQTSSTSFQIAAGKENFGAGAGTFAANASVTFNGTSSGAHGILSYFDFAGEAHVILPDGLYPGASGTALNAPCSGVSNCIVKAASSTSGGGRYVAATPVSLPSSSYQDNYLAEPIFSSAFGCASTITLTGNAAIPPVSGSSGVGLYTRTDGPFNAGTAFYADSSGFVCGMRFLLGSAQAGRQVALWLNGNSTALATAISAENAAAGTWQTVTFASPVSISAGTIYIVSYQVASGTTWYTWANGYENFGTDNAPLHVLPHYIDANGACDVSDSWPSDFAGRPAVGELDCATLSSGTIASVRNGDVNSSSYWGEGCQCMTGGAGPGPYALINNYLEGSGDYWHHDDAGRMWANPGDYEYWRNTFVIPDWPVSTSPTWDGNIYYTRQLNEWKDGKRLHLHGSRYIGSYNSIAGNALSIAFSFERANNPAGTDVNIENNIFYHTCGGPGLTGGFNLLPQRRFRLANNLVFDVNGTFNRWDQYDAGNSRACNGWMLQGLFPEDVIVDHNTIVGNQGTAPVLEWVFNINFEGVQITNNILFMPSPGVGMETGDAPVDNCSGLASGALFACRSPGGLVFQNNLLLPNGTTQAQLHDTDWSAYNSINYFDSGLSAPKFWNCAGSLCEGALSDFHLRYDSPYISGGTYRATDGTNVGVDSETLNVDLGVVTLVGESSVTSTSAAIAFTAPDAAGCPVDYSATDPAVVSSFTRVADAGGARSRSIALSGLAAHTKYYYRVNCAAEQPTGQFFTN